MGKISLLLPYWKRQEVTDAALDLMCHNYEHLDLEVIIVDDGSPEPYKLPDSVLIDVKVIHLPKKDGPMNSCLPYKVAADASVGEFIALSSPEMRHKMPVLGGMRETCIKEGDKAYVMAACWCPEQNRWHCHSSMRRVNTSDVGDYIPKGSNYHFMTMMSRKLWDEIGGFDQDYRGGAGYEDPDFVRRLDRAGAKFIYRDDLWVEHPKSGASSGWTQPMLDKNRELFLSKWDKIR